MATAGCNWTCLCTVLDKHSLFGFFTVLSPCDRGGCCPTLRAIHQREDEYLQEGSIKKKKKKKDSGTNEKANGSISSTSTSSLITPHVCPRFVMFAAVVLVNFFIFSFWSYILIVRGNYDSVRDGSDNDHVASLKGRFGGRDFTEVNECFTVNNAEMTFNVLTKTDAEILARDTGCTLDVLNRYYTECRVPKTEPNIDPKFCKALKCKAAINNLFSCLVVSKNQSTELYLALSQCGEDWASKDGTEKKEGSSKRTSNRESVSTTSPTAGGNGDYTPGSNKRNSTGPTSSSSSVSDTSLMPLAQVGVPLTNEQGQAVTKLGSCIKADCRAQANEMAIQLVSTIVLTGLLTLVLEKIVNSAYGFGEHDSGRCCGATCSRQRFCVGSGMLLVVVLAGMMVGMTMTARYALIKLKQSAPQRCILGTPQSLLGMLVTNFLPVLAMGWGTQVLTLLVSEWWAHRKIALAREKQEAQQGTKSEMVRI